MPDQLKINGRTLRLHQGDITDLEIESFVYYARPDLEIGSGFGTAISVRGGPSIQEELKALRPLKTTEAVVTSAGEMKASHIIHAVGPRFQEEDLEEKLEATIKNALKEAEAKGIRRMAFPPMGAGFYGVPLDLSARITLETIADHLRGDCGIDEIVVSLLDSREYKPFQERLKTLR